MHFSIISLASLLYVHAALTAVTSPSLNNSNAAVSSSLCAPSASAVALEVLHDAHRTPLNFLGKESIIRQALGDVQYHTDKWIDAIVSWDGEASSISDVDVGGSSLVSALQANTEKIMPSPNLTLVPIKKLQGPAEDLGISTKSLLDLLVKWKPKFDAAKESERIKNHIEKAGKASEAFSDVIESKLKDPTAKKKAGEAFLRLRSEFAKVLAVYNQ